MASPASEHNKPVSPRYFTGLFVEYVCLCLSHITLLVPAVFTGESETSEPSLRCSSCAVGSPVRPAAEKERLIHHSTCWRNDWKTILYKQHAKLHTVYKLDQECYNSMLEVPGWGLYEVASITYFTIIYI